MKLLKSIVYFSGWILFRVFYTLIGRLEIRGVSNIPLRESAIIASNHISLNDPQLIGCTIPRQVYYMGKKELFEIPVLGWILRIVNTFPVDRKKHDISAVRFSIELLRKKNILVMFPEGGRRKESVNENYKYGIGMLSCIGQVPVIPCLVVNSDKLFSFKKISVNFGEPVYPPQKYNRQTYEEITSLVMERIKELRKKYFIK